MEQLRIGQIVRSNSGRDKNSLFVVTKLSENGYVYLVDGKYRKVQNPKLKNTKHLDDMKRVASIQIDEKTKDPNSLNAKIRNELKRLGNEMEENSLCLKKT